MYEGCPPGTSAPGESAQAANYDSHVKLTEEYYIRMLVGMTILRLANWQVDAMAGFQGTRTEVTLFTDESGGGKSESFTRSRLQVSPTVGLQMRYNFGTVANASFYAGAIATLMRDERVGGDVRSWAYLPWQRQRRRANRGLPGRDV